MSRYKRAFLISGERQQKLSVSRHVTGCQRTPRQLDMPWCIMVCDDQDLCHFPNGQDMPGHAGFPLAYPDKANGTYPDHDTPCTTEDMSSGLGGGGGGGGGADPWHAWIRLGHKSVCCMRCDAVNEVTLHDSRMADSHRHQRLWVNPLDFPH